MPLYRVLFRKAWAVTIHHPMLWFFGVFAAPLVNGGVFEFVYQGVLLEPLNNRNVLQAITDNVNQYSMVRPIIALVERFAQLGGNAPSILLSVSLVFATLFLLWLTVVSIGALVNGIRSALKNEPSTIKEELRCGRESFVGVASTVLIASAAITLLFALMRGLLSLGVMLPHWALVISVPVFLLLIAELIIVYFTALYALAFIVLKHSTIKKALSDGFRIFANYWLVHIELAVGLFLMSVVVGSIGSIIIEQYIGIPTAQLLIKGFIAGVVPTLRVPLLLIEYLVYALMIGLWAILSVFQVSAFTALFLHLGRKIPIQSKTLRITELVKKLATRPTQPNDILE